MSARRPLHLWIVGILAFIWNAFGAFDYLATQLELEFYVSQFTPEQREYFTTFPTWMEAMWAFGVWGAFAGSIGLLLARGWAFWAFAISILGLGASTIYNFVITDGAQIMGSAAVGMTVMIWVIALALLVYTMVQRKQGRLR